MFSPFDFFLFDILPIIISIMFMIVFGMMIVKIISSIGRWQKNNASPILTVEAKVVTKRTNTSHHHHNHDMSNLSSTDYYVTFEVESGDRMELRVQGKEYGMLVEQDRGKLTFQGTRYLSFQRI